MFFTLTFFFLLSPLTEHAHKVTFRDHSYNFCSATVQCEYWLSDHRGVDHF